MVFDGVVYRQEFDTIAGEWVDFSDWFSHCREAERSVSAGG